MVRRPCQASRHFTRLEVLENYLDIQVRFLTLSGDFYAELERKTAGRRATEQRVPHSYAVDIPINVHSNAMTVL